MNEKPCFIKIHVKVAQNEMIVEIAKFATISDLKNSLEQKTQIPALNQKIIFNGKTLKDGDTFHKLKIKNGARIVMLGLKNEKIPKTHNTNNNNNPLPIQVQKKKKEINSYIGEIEEFKVKSNQLKENAQKAIEDTTVEEIKRKTKLFLENEKRNFFLFNHLNNIMMDLDGIKQDNRESYDKDELGKRMIRDCNNILNHVDNLKHLLEEIVSTEEESQVFILYKKSFL
eukprot:TRINITY_DN5834_c0_g1_i1.p1 TRINITY_DN5834_c0_g1~~TRINITY_DN5834_c0_g1_i1.p1  ORF type:complete len:228 (+),score=78.81 TRINITY_DN5834_c0_g1_i1:95-778(+)